MHNEAHFRKAEELSALLDPKPAEALAKALHYRTDAHLNETRLIERSGLDRARYEYLVYGHNFDDFNPGESRNFVLAVIELLAEFGQHPPEGF